MYKIWSRFIDTINVNYKQNEKDATTLKMQRDVVGVKLSEARNKLNAEYKSIEADPKMALILDYDAKIRNLEKENSTMQDSICAYLPKNSP